MRRVTQYVSVVKVLGFLIFFMAALGAEAQKPGEVSHNSSPDLRSNATSGGVAFFALNAPSFPCDTALKVFEPGSNITALAVLWATFGNDMSCLNRWAALMQSLAVPHVLQIHLSNETCRRAKNRKCSDAELSPNLSVNQYNRALEERQADVTSALSRRVAEIKGVVEKFRGVNLELIISTGLEDNYTAKAYATVLELVRAEWPYSIVRNPVGALKDRTPLGAEYLELHGAKPGFAANQPCIANLDGEDMAFPHRRAVTSKMVSWQGVGNYWNRFRKVCRVTFLWSAPWQGLFSDKFPPTDQRQFEVSAADVEAIRLLAR